MILDYQFKDENLINQFVKAKIIDVKNYDYIGELVKESQVEK